MGNRKLKPQVKVVLIIILLLISAIAVENIINLLVNVTEEVKTKNEIKKEQEEYMSTPEYEEEQYIEGCVKKAMEYLNSGDYDALYSVTDPEYKAYMQIDSMDKFMVLIKKFVGDADSVKLLNYGIRHGRYVCDVLFMSENNTFTKRLLVTPFENSEEFYIIFDDIYSIEKHEGRFRTFDDKIDYSLVYIVDKGNSKEYVLDVTNKTNKDMIGSFRRTYMTKTNKLTYPVQNKEELDNITIPAGETIRLDFEIDTSDPTAYAFLDDIMYIKFDFADGTKKEDMIILQWEYWE